MTPVKSNRNAVPADILADLLEVTGAAIMSGDFDAFIDCICLPHEIETPDGIKNLETRDDARAVFINVCRHMAHSGVTSIVRHCTAAEYQSEHVILASHETRLISGSTLMRQPYPCFSRLLFCRGRWTIKSSIYAIENDARHAAALTGSR